MGNTQDKYASYQQQYESMNNDTKSNINSLDLEHLDPYKVLNVSKKFTWNELKDAYKKLAIKTHPDKGGNKVVFDFVTTCFETLAKEYQMRKQDKMHNELKKESNDYFDRFVNTNIPHPSVGISDTNEPFQKRFNKIFEDCKYQDEDIEYGYGSIMSKSGVREDITIENVFHKEKVDNSTFNEIFNKKVPVSKSVVKYKEPEALPMAKNLQFTEIGSKRPDDYSSGTDKSSLKYTDYMRAYDGNRLADPEDIKSIKNFKSVKEYQAYRDNKMKKTLTDKEKKYMEKQKELEERQEWERQERIRKQNLAIQKAHEKANMLFLK